MCMIEYRKMIFIFSCYLSLTLLFVRRGNFYDFRFFLLVGIASFLSGRRSFSGRHFERFFLSGGFRLWKKNEINK